MHHDAAVLKSSDGKKKGKKNKGKFHSPPVINTIVS